MHTCGHEKIVQISGILQRCRNQIPVKGILQDGEESKQYLQDKSIISVELFTEISSHKRLS